MEARNVEYNEPEPATRTMQRTESTTTARCFEKPLDAPVEEQPPKESGPAKPKPHKPKPSHRVKLDRARPRIMLLVACVAYLVTALVALDVGLLNLSSFVQPRFERAQLEYQAQSDTLHKEQIIYGRLEALLSTQLNRGFMETHEDCLVRGLKKADYELFGSIFQYADIRAQVMDWTMENCGKLQYTPQVVHKEPSPQQAVMAYWENMSYRSRQTIERALGFMKQIWIRVLGRNHSQNNSTTNKTAPAGNDTTKVIWDQRLRTEVPFGFALDCPPKKPCRLVYPLASSLRSDKMGVSPEHLAKIRREARVLHTFSVHLASHRHAIERAIFILLVAESFLMLVACVATVLTPLPAAIQAVPKEKRTLALFYQSDVSKEERYTVVSFLIEVAAIKALAMLEKGLAASWSKDFTLLLGLGMILLGLTMLISFFFASKKLEDVFRVCGLVKEIYLIARGRDIPGEKKEVMTPSPTTKKITLISFSKEKEEAIDTQESEQPKYVERIVHAPSTITEDSKPHHRLANPSTTIQEDLEAERKSLHEELTQAAIDNGESEFYSDTDTDSELEQERSFLDLASGITPDITEAESGWSLVD
jgi:hypothetical protein